MFLECKYEFVSAIRVLSRENSTTVAWNGSFGSVQIEAYRDTVARKQYANVNIENS